MFSNVRVNQQIYILDKADRTFEIGTVCEEPKVRYSTQPAQQQFNMPYPQQMTVHVVDLKVQTSHGIQPILGLPVDKTVFDNQAKTVFITEDKESMLNELRTLKSQSENHIKMTKYHEEMIPKYDEWIDVLNPEEAEKKRQEQKIKNLEKAYEEQSKAMRQMMESNQEQIEQNRQLMQQIQMMLKGSDNGNSKSSKNKDNA